jgi:DNA-binding beta-propeller fold protein YncE
LLDPNNRPGGPNLILTAKNANKVQFFDAATLAKTGEIVMPASTHEMVLSPDGTKAYGSIYGGGRFGETKNPDRRIGVIDLASKSLERTIDVGENLAPHGLALAGSTLWVTGELANLLFAIEPGSGAIQRVPLSGSPHWLAVSQPLGRIFASYKTDHFVAVVDAARREEIDRIRIPGRAEGIATSPDGKTLYVCAHERAECHAFDARTHALKRSIAIEGAEGRNQLKRVRASPDGKYVVVSVNFEAHAAIFDAGSFTQIALIRTKKSPMGFGFAADGRHAYICCHDEATVLEFDLASSRVMREFATDKGCEFIISYG